MEEIEVKFMALVKEQYDKTAGYNGLDLYGINEKLSISATELMEMVNKLLKEKKIVYLNPLNKRTITLPK